MHFQPGFTCGGAVSRRSNACAAAAFLLLLISQGVLADDWPQWRGPFRSGYAAPDAPAIGALSAELPPVWRIPIGGGFSSPVVLGTMLIYCDGKDGKEIVHCV